MPQRRPPSRRRSPKVTYAVAAAVLWGVAVAGLVVLTDWTFYAAWLAGGSVVTLLLYAFDKSQSRAGGGRVPELVLQGLALLGGVAGGWLGMLVVRHKTRHVSFWVIMVLATILHLGIAWWLYRG